MHALLKVGETDLMFSDTFPGMPYQTGNHVNIAVVTNDADRSRHIFDALAEGVQVNMPLQETFWSPAYGQGRYKRIYLVRADPSGSYRYWVGGWFTGTKNLIEANIPSWCVRSGVGRAHSANRLVPGTLPTNSKEETKP